MSVAPDALFDADLSLPLGREGWVDRFDWVVVDGPDGARIVHAPATWAWRCPECGETGTMPDALGLLPSPHGAQHAAGPFDPIVPLQVDAIRPDLG